MEISWEQYHGMIEELDSRIHSAVPSGPINLVGIPRGGLVIALYLTYLDSRYEILNPDVHSFAREGVVVMVDDVLETGKTREKWKKIVSNCFCPEKILFASLIDKSCYYHIPSSDISILNMDKKEWVVFPYERRGNVKEIESMKVRGYEQERHG